MLGNVTVMLETPSIKEQYISPYRKLHHVKKKKNVLIYSCGYSLKRIKIITFKNECYYTVYIFKKKNTHLLGRVENWPAEWCKVHS